MSKKLNTANDIIDLDLSAIRKKRFRIDGDDSRIVELNTSDLNILPRLKEAYPKLQELNKKVAELAPEVSSDNSETEFGDETFNKTIDVLVNIDKSMRELIDYIFDSNVSEVCAPSGSMYDPIGGQCRFEHIITCLSNLYETDLNTELNQLSKRTEKYTAKYTRKK